MNAEYEALRAKVDAFAERVGQRRADSMQCRAGCSGCCHAHLEVCDVEVEAIEAALAALDEAARADLGRRLRERSAEDPRCALLDDDGRCVVYAGRPLVCRTQGLPLRYPVDTIPVEAVRASAGRGEVTWCPLNFESDPPRAEDVLDAERVDRMLALVNRRASADPLRRTSLKALAERAVSEEGADAR